VGTFATVLFRAAPSLLSLRDCAESAPADGCPTGQTRRFSLVDSDVREEAAKALQVRKAGFMGKSVESWRDAVAAEPGMPGGGTWHGDTAAR
jgi:hypothetical protein